MTSTADPLPRRQLTVGQEIVTLPARLRRRVAAQKARWRLEREFRKLMSTAAPAVRSTGAPAAGPRVAVATFGSGTWHLVLETLLAHALALRGARPELLVCDLPNLPVCDERTVLLRDPRTCHGCVSEKRALLEACRMPWRGLSTFVDDGSLDRARRTVAGLSNDAVEGYTEDGWPLGRLTFVSACHYLRSDARGGSPEAIAVRRSFLATAIVVRSAVERWLNEIRPEILIAESGGHFMWRIAFEIARARGIRVVCREIGKGGWDHHIYSLNAECMFPNLNGIWDEVRRQPLSAAQSNRVSAYLQSLPARTYASAAHVVREAEPEALKRELGLRAERRVAVLFTGVTWDLATAGRDVGFDGMFDWIGETLRLAVSLPNVQFVIRAHPAEMSGETRERTLGRIREHWPELPDNVTAVAPQDALSVGSLCGIADLVVTYCSTTGMEAAIYGRDVMVCGAPHYRGRGFTIDVTSRQEYGELLRRWAQGALSPMPPETAETARRYFHLFYFRYHIEMGWTTSPLQPPFGLIIRDLAKLLPGNSGAVDAVCSAILEGREIVLPATEECGL
jgi:hypothetical protein